MGSPFLILAHSFKKESLGRTTTLANSFVPLFGLEQEFYGLADEIFWLSFSNV